MAPHGELERTGDGSGGHDQKVGIVSLLPKRPSLPHPETVLFVNNGQGQAVKRHAFLDQRMGADDDTDGAVLQPSVDLIPILPGDAPGEQPDLDVVTEGLVEQTRDGPVMLLDRKSVV